MKFHLLTYTGLPGIRKNTAQESFCAILLFSVLHFLLGTVFYIEVLQE